MDQNLALEFVRVTEAAALSCARMMGRGDQHGADQAAVSAMRNALNSLNIDGEVVIGEGERDKAPMLYIGEKVGSGKGRFVEIALDPLEGTTICANGTENALSVLAAGDKGSLLRAPDVYMQKIAVGPKAKGAIDLTKSPSDNLRNVAKKLNCEISDLCVVVLDRERHLDLIAEIRDAGARIKLIGDGDVSGAIATCKFRSGVDLLMGIGGAPEGVLAAAAIRCFDGDMQGRLIFTEDTQVERARAMGVDDIDKIYQLTDLAGEDVFFSATGVTDGSMLKGVRYFPGGAITNSVVMRSKSGTVRTLITEHFFDKDPDYGW